MRCRPASEEVVQRKTTSTPKAKPAETPKKPPSKAPSDWAPVEEDGMLGGLFDGACDYIGLDGANDERPVLDDGRVKPNPPPGFTWDATRGAFRHRDAYAQSMPGAFPGQQVDAELGVHQTAKDFVASYEQENPAPQFDGPGDWPNGYNDGYPGQQRDDLGGDRHLGMTGRDGSDYKQFYRERGDTVSQTPGPVVGIGLMEGFTCTTQAALEEIQKAPPVAKDSARFLAASQNKGHYEDTPVGLRLFASDLEAMRQDLTAQNQKNPRLNTDEAWRDWRLLEAKLHSMRAGRPQERAQYGREQTCGSDSSRTKQDALDDLRGLRFELERAAQIYPDVDINAWLSKLSEAETQLQTDPLWTQQSCPDEASRLLAHRAQLSWRNQLLSKVLKALYGLDPSYPTTHIEERVQAVRQEGTATHERLKELGVGPPGVSQRYGHTTPTSARHVNFRQGLDGTPSQPNGTPVTTNQDTFWKSGNAGNHADWQEVGGGSLKPGQQTGGGWGLSKPASTHEHFVGEQMNDANTWGGEGVGAKTSNEWEAPGVDTQGGSRQDAGWASVAGSKVGGQRETSGWGDNGNQQQQGGGGWAGDTQAQNGWDRPNSAGRPPSDAESYKNDGGSKAGWGASSKHSSRNNSGGDAWKCGDGEAGDGRGATSNKNHGKAGNWGGGGQQSNAGSGAKGSTRGSNTSSPKEVVKPYWKNWDKPADVTSSSQMSPAPRREMAREVYTWPAAKLPAIPEGKVASASHGIQAGRGAEYNHLCRRPVYIDSMEKPYAVFSFKYRSKEKLKQITGLKVRSVDDDVKAVQKQVQKDKLMQMPKDQLIEQLMQSSASKSGSQKAPSDSGGQGWGQKHASNAGGGWDKRSSKAKSAAGGEWAGQSNKAGEGVDGWGTQNNHGGGGGAWGGQSDNGGGGGGWGASNHIEPSNSADHLAGKSGKNDATRDNQASANAGATPGEYKFDYDAYKYSDNGAEEVKTGPAKNEWERESSSSIFQDPYGVLWKGGTQVGKRSWAQSSTVRSKAGEGKGADGGGGWDAAPAAGDMGW